MKQYTLEDIRALKGLPNGVLQTKFGEIDNALASSYLNRLIVRTQVRAIKEKKDYPIISEFMFIQEQMEQMELTIMKLKQENENLNMKIKYLTND
jgi:hypothetical protein